MSSIASPMARTSARTEQGGHPIQQRVSLIDVTRGLLFLLMTNTHALLLSKVSVDSFWHSAYWLPHGWSTVCFILLSGYTMGFLLPWQGHQAVTRAKLLRSSRDILVVMFGKFHIRRKVGNSFLGQGAVFRHCPLCGSLYLRLWLTRRPCVRLFLRATRARSVPVLFLSGVRSGLYLRACRAQSADDYAHTRTVPASPDPLAHGRSPAAVAERS